MSYWLEDENGYLGDFATNKGIIDLRQGAPDSLKQFLDQGYADEKLLKELLADEEVPKYIRELLNKAEPPISITDGCGGEM